MFPLLDTTFEGVPAKIPFKYKEFLAAEYGAKSLYNKNFHEYAFSSLPHCSFYLILTTSQGTSLTTRQWNGYHSI